MFEGFFFLQVRLYSQTITQRIYMINTYMSQHKINHITTSHANHTYSHKTHQTTPHTLQSQHTLTLPKHNTQHIHTSNSSKFSTLFSISISTKLWCRRKIFKILKQPKFLLIPIHYSLDLLSKTREIGPMEIRWYTFR